MIIILTQHQNYDNIPQIFLKTNVIKLNRPRGQPSKKMYFNKTSHLQYFINSQENALKTWNVPQKKDLAIQAGEQARNWITVALLAKTEGNNYSHM